MSMVYLMIGINQDLKKQNKNENKNLPETFYIDRAPFQKVKRYNFDF